MLTNLIRALDHGWEGIPVEGYRPGAAPGVERHTIVGRRKNDPQESGPALEVRYFELAPGAATRLEKHQHEHFVIVKSGFGHAIVGETLAEISPHDVVYVGSFQPHQFLNRGEESFGFFCIVDAARDRSQELSSAELAALKCSPAGRVMRTDLPRPSPQL